MSLLGINKRGKLVVGGIVAFALIATASTGLAAWVIGMRSMQKALLSALVTPNAALKALQDENKLTELLVMQEEIKTLPFGDIWAEYCARQGVAADKAWFGDNLLSLY